MKKFSVLFLFIIALFLTGCSTLKVEVIKNVPIPQAGNKIVFLQADYSERVLPILPLIDAGIYNKRVNAISNEFKQIQNDNAQILNKKSMDCIKAKTGCEIIPVTSVIDSNAYDKYENLTPEQKEKIKSICKTNNAPYAVAMTLQVQIYEVSAFGLSGNNTLNSAIYVFDRDASLVGKGFYRSEKVKSSPTDTASYKDLLSNGEKLSEQLIAILFK